MKKIFWTSIIFVLIVGGFWIYARFFDAELGQRAAHLFASDLPVATTTVSTGQTLSDSISMSLNTLGTNLDILAKKVSDLKAEFIQALSSSTPVASSTTVKLYYFNEKEDKILPPEQQANPESLSPVFRTVSVSDTLIPDTISLLLQGALTESEVQAGFTSSFIRVIRLTDVKLDGDGTLSLSFEKAPNVSIGGSAFISILTNSIIKTALQFPQVKKVNLLPEELFQP